MYPARTLWQAQRADRARGLVNGEPAGLSLHSLCSWVARVPWDLTAQVTALPTPGLPPFPVLITALPKVMPSAVDVNCSAASPDKGGRARTASISARAGQRPARAETRAPAPLDPAWRQTFLEEREGPRWQVKRDHPGGSNGTGWRAAYSEIRVCNKSAGCCGTGMCQNEQPKAVQSHWEMGSYRQDTLNSERTARGAHQLRAELLLHPLLVPGVHSRVPQVPNSLGDEQVETVLHCKHEQRPVQRNTNQ